MFITYTKGTSHNNVIIPCNTIFIPLPMLISPSDFAPNMTGLAVFPVDGVEDEGSMTCSNILSECNCITSYEIHRSIKRELRTRSVDKLLCIFMYM